jgi:hypothetical protein
MKPSRWKIKVALLLAGAAAILAVLYAWPGVSLWYAKAQAMRELSKVSNNDRAAIHCVLAPQVKQVPTIESAGERVGCAADGWRFSLPADEFRRSEDPNRPHVLEGGRVAVHVFGASIKTPQFRQAYAPTNDEVQCYYEQTDPYEILCDAFTATPAQVEAARTHAELQKTLYLLLLRSILQPVGSDKQWLRLEIGGRRAILAGDATCKIIPVSIYLPQTRQFADIGIAPKNGATLDDVYRCLGQLRIERQELPSLVPTTAAFGR